MKRVILFICCVLLLDSCRTPKKLVSSTAETVTNNETQNEAISSETYNFADTTKKQEVEINYYKIEFYPPAVPNEPDTIPIGILSKGIIERAENPKIKPPPTGAIKSIEGYIVKEKIEQSGVNESTEIAQVNRNTEKNEDISQQAEIKEQPAHDPYRWRYILAIIVSVILGVVYFVLQKTNLITTLISFVKKLF
jgi:hypothetical protein